MLIPRLHVITPVVPASHLVPLAAAGVDAVQVRDKLASDRDLLAFVTAAVRLLRPLGTAVIVNDRVDLALAAGADGVHLGAGDLPVNVARSLAPRLLIGATCRSRHQVEVAAAAGADYVGVGPVHLTTTKSGLPEPLGTDGIEAAVGVVPVIAIGGLTAERIAGVLAAGAHGVAVAGAIAQAVDPPQTAREIAAALLRG